MRLKDSLSFSINSLINRGIRSWLTILGVVIGISAVVAIVSMGFGLQESVSAQLGSFGANTVTITPGYSRATSSGGAFRGPPGGERSELGSTEGALTINDERILETIPGVLYVDGRVSKRGEVSYLNEEAQVSIQGVRPEVWSQIVTAELSGGRLLAQSDSLVAVVGSRVASELFSQPLNLNGQIAIEGRSFRIAGVLAPSTSGSDDSQIFIPRSVAVNILEDVEKDEFTSIVVELSEDANLTTVSENIKSQLLISHRILPDDQDFTVSNPQAFQSRIQETTQTLTLFLGGIAAISLLVGAVGIANTMYMSVLERTRQVGTLKALGATNNEVMVLFIIESGLMGFVGGVFGIIFGVIASGLLSNVGIRFGRAGSAQTVIPPELLVFALLFSVIIGIVAGVFPAKKASSLQPVEALRYE
ncbi:MAG TPA: ABC transporter permease [Euryarchaeota archaeon]|nr:macrolide export ATP-binding/permease protein MacB [archaeon BMS3Bbin16]HDH27919.1 ABC transporter permease [Euryarchaeota archaeon]